MSQKRRDNKGRVLRSGESQRSDGQYMFRYTDNAGVRRTLYSWKLVASDKVPEDKRTATALREMEKQIQKDLDDGIDGNTASRTTVDDLFQQFMELRRDLRESTRCCYLAIYTKHVKDVLGSKPIDKVRATDIQSLYNQMVYQTKVKPSTAQKAHSILYQMFENAVLDHLLRTNPASHAFQNLRKTADLTPASREPLSVRQQKIFIAYVCGSPYCSDISNLLIVLLGTGMRIGEALGLRWCDCDFDSEVIRVTHALLYRQGEDGHYRYRISKTKTKAGIREIPMFDDVRDALLRERHRPNRERTPFEVDGYKDFVFINRQGKVYTPSFIYDKLQNIVASYNKEEAVMAAAEKREPCYLPKISAHIFRHTFSTRMCEYDMNIKTLQDVMGHKNIRTTMDTYTKAMREKKQAEFQALNAKFKLV